MFDLQRAPRRAPSTTSIDDLPARGPEPVTDGLVLVTFACAHGGHAAGEVAAVSPTEAADLRVRGIAR